MIIIIDIIVAIVIGSITSLIYWYSIKRRAKKYCTYYHLNFEKFWKDIDKIDFSNPDWDVPYIISGKCRVFGKFEILESEVKRRLNN